MNENTRTFADPSDDRLNEAIAAFEEARDAGLTPNPLDWPGRFPDVAERLRAYFVSAQSLRSLTQPLLNGAQLPDAGAFDDYEILELIFEGGMGIVYKARRKSTQQIVALKLIRPELLQGLSPEKRRRILERFITEAQVAARLEHENIVKVYDVGESSGHLYYSMRYVQGKSLSGLIQDGLMSPRKAAAYLEQIARAVHLAHQHGIIHRDLKPNNILVDAQSDRPLVADFGLAKLVDRNQDLTQTRDIMGAPPYMSPEQAQNSAHVTTATDVYGLGATLYALLTGRPPFQADTPLATLKKVLDEEPMPPRQLNPAAPRDLETICLKCLHKDPHKRYASAEALAQDLKRFRDGRLIRGRPTPRWERAWMWMKRRPLVASLYGTLAVVLLLAFSIGIWQWRETLQALREARINLYAHRVNNAERLLAAGISDLAENELDLCPDNLHDWEWHYLKRWCKGDVVALKLSGRPIAAYALHPDGKMLVEGDDLGVIQAWGGNQFQEPASLGQYKNPVSSISCQSNICAVAFKGDTTVKVFKNDPLKKWVPLEFQVKGERVAVSPDGNFLATAEFDGTLWVQDLRDSAIKPRELTHKKKHSATCLAFSPDSRFLVSGGYGKEKIRFWDVVKGDEMHWKLPKLDLSVWAIAFSPNAKWFAFSDGTSIGLCKWGDLAANKFDKEARLHGGFTGFFQSLAFSADSKYLAATTNSGSVTAWDVQSKAIAFNARRHRGMILSVAFNLEQVPQPIPLVNVADIQPPPSLVYLRGHEVVMEKWKAPSGRPIQELLLPPAVKNQVRHVAFDGKNARAAVASQDGKVMVLNLRGEPGRLDLVEPKRPLAALAFSGDGRRLTGVDDDRSIYVWDLATRKLESSLVTERDKTTTSQVAVDNKGQRLAVVDDDGRVEVWDWQKSPTKIVALKEPGPVKCVALSASGRYLAFGANSGLLTIWDLQSKTEFAQLTGHQNEVLSLAFSPDSDAKYVVSGSWDCTVKLWDVRAKTLLRTFEGQGGKVTSVCFSQNGRRIAAAAGPVVRLLDTMHKHQEIALQDHRTGVTGISFCGPGGAILASASEDGIIKTWNGTPLDAAPR